MKITLLALAIVFLAGCANGDRTDLETPKNWKVFSTSGNYISYVIPVTMDDGTKCVIVTANNAGRGISCNWTDAK